MPRVHGTEVEVNPNRRHWIIAIDGPSGAGKSTVAKRLARQLGYLYVDTGAMYRAIGLKALRHNPKLDDVAQIASIAQASTVELMDSAAGSRVFLDGEEVTEAIRSEAVSQAASIVSGISEVRRVLVRAQQQMGASRNVVLEGRDIGTKVFPEANLKIFLDASEETRARRRFEENRRKGVTLSFEETLAEINGRDRRDSQRADSPLVKAEDAVYVDTSGKAVEEVLREILRLVEERQAQEQETRPHET
jgi:cytidylate kinase